MAKKRRKPAEAGIPEWVVTYGDMMSLLLTFFILLNAFSELKQPREFRRVLDEIKEALGFVGGLGQAHIPDTPTNATVNMLEAQAKRDGQKLNVNENPEDSVVGRHRKTDIVHDGNWHTVGASIPFEPGSWTVSRSAAQVCKEDIAPRLRGKRNIARVVGHSWGYEDLLARDGGAGGVGGAGSANDVTHVQLSFLRAQAVHDYLVAECGIDPAVLRIEIAADNEPMELPSLDTRGGTQNRRVQVYLTDRTLDDMHPDPELSGRAR